MIFCIDDWSTTTMIELMIPERMYLQNDQQEQPTLLRMTETEECKDKDKFLIFSCAVVTCFRT